MKSKSSIKKIIIETIITIIIMKA